jgi:hypothetical protein
MHKKVFLSDDVIVLDINDAIANGAQRMVFVHPNDPTLLIKVHKHQDPAVFKRTLDGWFRKKKSLHYSYKEYVEYARVMLSHTNMSIALPISHMYGFVHTSLGVGCVTEHVVQENGITGNTVRHKCETMQFTLSDLGSLNEAVTQIFSLGVRVSDANPGNFVFGYRRASALGFRPVYGCFLVDGFGDSYPITVRSWCRWTNSLGLNDCFKRMSKKIELKWDGRARRFTLP